MSLIKITTNEINSVKKYMTELMSFDQGIIELVVGWDLAKEKGAKITNPKIDEKTYWTFLPTEKRNNFLNSIVDIEKIGLEYLISTKKIININPFDYMSENDFLVYIKNDLSECKVYLFKERLYLYEGNDIYHIDMGLLNFMSWDILKEIKNYFDIIELDENEYNKYINYIDFKYIPYLIDAKKNIIISDICNT